MDKLIILTTQKESSSEVKPPGIPEQSTLTKNEWTPSVYQEHQESLREWEVTSSTGVDTYWVQNLQLNYIN